RYVDWLNRYEAPPFSLSEAEKAKLAEAEATLDTWFDIYTEYETEYINMYFAWYDLFTMPKEDRPKNYSSQLAKAKRLLDQARKAWEAPSKGNRADVEKAMAIVSDLTRRDPAFTKQRMIDKLGEAIQSSHGEYYPTLIYPANPLGDAPVFKNLEADLKEAGYAKDLDEGISWPKFTFSSNEIKDYQKADSYKWGGQASVGALLWSASVEHEGTREYTEHSTDISKMAMEFELLRAPILRSWFSSFLLMGRGWKWPEMSQDHPETNDLFSDGKLPASGSWQMVPTEIIMVRKLKVKIDMSSSVNRESLTKTRSALQAGYGFFKIKGSVETSNGTKEYEFEETADGIECEQPQIVGYFCQLMPKSPNPDWNLWNKKPETVAASAPALS
ncbi:MAG TPA: hypothetical protein VK364_01745, partial [Hymenobacter sp.]|nr:hypothetical protein [Hymenobacter sp.]